LDREGYENERDDFLAVTIPRQIEAETAIHNGDTALRMAMWSRNDPVTLFGAAVSGSGWEELSRVFEWLTSIFSDCESYELEILAAGASGDLAYTVGHEHTKASVEGVPQRTSCGSHIFIGGKTVSGRSSTGMPTRRHQSMCRPPKAE
jgi:hypothetical protein